jgi:hypothetical protein
MVAYRINLKSQDNEQRRYVTLGAETEEDAREQARAFEHSYVEFRLDDPATREKYGYPADVLAQVEDQTRIYAEDTDEDGRFIRAGKVIGRDRRMRGWLALHNQEKPYRITAAGRADEAMVVTAGLYGVPAKNRSDGTANGSVNWSPTGDTIKCALTTSAYDPTTGIDTHAFFNQVTNEVAATGGYTAGGNTLASLSSSYDTASDQARFTAANTSWTSSTITARNAIVYKSTGTASTSPLISFVAFGADVSTTAGTFQITWDATGIWIIDVT